MGLKNGCGGGYWRLKSGRSGRAGGCTTVGEQWGADRSGWGVTDSHPPTARGGGGTTPPLPARACLRGSAGAQLLGASVQLPQVRLPAFTHTRCTRRSSVSVGSWCLAANYPLPLVNGPGDDFPADGFHLPPSVGGGGRISVSENLCEIPVRNLFGGFKELHGYPFGWAFAPLSPAARFGGR